MTLGREPTVISLTKQLGVFSLMGERGEAVGGKSSRQWSENQANEERGSSPPLNRKSINQRQSKWERGCGVGRFRRGLCHLAAPVMDSKRVQYPNGELYVLPKDASSRLWCVVNLLQFSQRTVFDLQLGAQWSDGKTWKRRNDTQHELTVNWSEMWAKPQGIH